MIIDGNLFELCELSETNRTLKWYIFPPLSQTRACLRTADDNSWLSSRKKTLRSRHKIPWPPKIRLSIHRLLSKWLLSIAFRYTRDYVDSFASATAQIWKASIIHYDTICLAGFCFALHLLLPIIHRIGFGSLLWHSIYSPNLTHTHTHTFKRHKSVWFNIFAVTADVWRFCMLSVSRWHRTICAWWKLEITRTAEHFFNIFGRYSTRFDILKSSHWNWTYVSKYCRRRHVHAHTFPSSTSNFRSGTLQWSQIEESVYISQSWVFLHTRTKVTSFLIPISPCLK